MHDMLVDDRDGEEDVTDSDRLVREEEAKLDWGPCVIDWDALQRIEPQRYRLRRRPTRRRSALLPKPACVGS